MHYRHLGWLTIAALLTAGCNGFGNWNYPTVRGSGTVITEERPVRDFDRVSVAGAGRLTVVQGDEESLSITTDDNLLPYIAAEVSDRHLDIFPDQVNLRPSRSIDYVLKLKNLNALNLSGSLSAKADALAADALTVRISGSGSIRIDRLEADQTELRISGSGAGELAGKVTSQTLRVSGSGNYAAGDLESEVADIHISGSGDATVWVKEQIEAHISGSGSVAYYGAPQSTQHISGSGKIRSLGMKE